MNSRLTLQDLAGLLADYTGKDKKATERFLKDFIAVVSQGVYTDKIVKVKGLGTFKIISVDKRESVHVNTGERFVIPEHYKFSFLPDKELKGLVNKPFSFFETTELNENVDFSDLSESIDDGKEVETEDESVEELVPDEEIPVATTTNHPQATSSSVKTVLMVCTLLVVIAICLYLYVTSGKGTDMRLPEALPAAIEAVVPEDSLVAQADSVSLPTDTTSLFTETEEKISANDSTNVIGRTTIKLGDRLTLIALEYYGNKIFWVYLYEFNKSKITDPNNVPIGTELEIPAADLYGIDAKSRLSLEKASLKQADILNQNKTKQE